jgi:hypothetical protein
MTIQIRRCLILFVWLCTFQRLHGQVTAFSYNGRLSDNGQPANGSYDMNFALFDALNGGGTVGTLQTKSDVSVTDGLFALTLDFGANVFTGPPRWLEIAVRHTGTPNFITLAPRQGLSSSPYAVYALSAASVSGDLAIKDASITSAKIAPGQVVKSLNGLTDVVTLQAGTPNLTINPVGNSLVLSVTGGPGGGGGGSSIWNLNGANTYYSAGNVGIGTASPDHRLSISGGPGWTANGWGGALELDSGAALAWKSNTGGQRFGMGHTDGGFFIFRTASDPGTTASQATYDFAINDVGRATIGRRANGPGLDIYGEWDGAEQGALSLIADKPSLRLTGGLSTLGNSWLIHVGSDGPGDLEFFNKQRAGVLNTSFGLVMALAPTGQLGIGTATPSSMVDIAGQDGLSIRGFEPFLTIFDTDPKEGLNRRGRIQSARGELVFFTDSYLANTNPNSYAKLFNTGEFSVATLTIRGGADLAEPFKMSTDEIPEGAVVIIDDDHPGQLKMSTEAYDTRVAGVVSGANGVHPGISLRQLSGRDEGANVALSGRVYVKADAGYGAIKPGDLLTSSNTPGHAMKVSDHARAQGAVLGKAMSSLKEGKGLVLLLVTLQ